MTVIRMNKEDFCEVVKATFKKIGCGIFEDDKNVQVCHKGRIVGIEFRKSMPEYWVVEDPGFFSDAVVIAHDLEQMVPQELEIHLIFDEKLIPSV